ncbi:hypothetical protein CPB84DRAFT_1834375 [Gymnopilus junonius]|uniref:Uncharacterized protein n=1 Tax=Gymnopilus junonius TaxID=109634 RepID=A0A9P5TSQ8_GYMJU|nr:hypothetical protein CPB84DRAFT_1834375 [Gymnopilus junonius]
MSVCDVNTWAQALVADPYTTGIVSSRLRDLLSGKAVGNPDGIAKGGSATKALEHFVQQTDWAFKPEAFDAVWQEQFLIDEAQDAIPAEDGDDENEGLTDGYDKSWITTAIGDARLYALGHGYSSFAWNAFLDGLGLGRAVRSKFG